MIEKAKIGLDARPYNWTGIGRYLRNLIDQLLVIDQENEYVLFLEKDAAEQVPDSPKVKKVIVDIPHYSWKEQTSMPRVIQKEDCDLVHFPHFNMPITYKDPFIVTIHDLTLSFFPGQKMTSFLHRTGYQATIKHACKKAKRIIAVSKNTAKDIENLMKVDQSKIDIIYEAVEFDKYHNRHSEEGIVEMKSRFNLKKPYLLYVGVWRSHKNILGMLSAFRKILDRGIDCNLVITGKPDPHYPEVKNKIKELKLENRVIFPGFVPDEDLPLMYAGADLFVWPSFYEGFGLPPLEAMASGTPVISSNTSAMPEILGKAAEFFDPYDDEEIALAMERVLRDRGHREQLKEKGLLHVKQFQWKKMAEETLKVYQKELGRLNGSR